VNYSRCYTVSLLEALRIFRLYRVNVV